MARVDYNNYQLETWHYLSGVYDGAEGKVHFYVDGKLVGSDELGGNDLYLSDKSLGLNLPAAMHGSSKQRGSTNCILYEARLWNSARIQEDIIEYMYKNLGGSEDGLIGCWQLKDGPGSTAYDLTENKNHGEVINGRWQTDN